MAISVFPAGGGEFITNDFVVDMNNSENNVVDLGRSYAAGSYNVTLASGDTSFDIYAIDADGASVGYTNNATLITSDAFTSLVILGVSTTEKITFGFAGASNNTTSEGDATGAGAYLESVSPTDLPNIDDTTNVVGGNFATDVEIYFESGAVSTPAKQVARADSQNLIVTRPDTLDPDLDPWDVKAINPGVTPPTGSNAHILAGTVDAGATPVWVTTSPLATGTANVAYSDTLEATDADGAVTYSITSGSLPTGLSLDSSTGVISGTPTAAGQTFTALATDEGGNSNSREFALPVQLATGGTISTVNGSTVHEFLGSDDFVALVDIPGAEYVVVAGGGGGGSGSFTNSAGGGGGAGGYRSSVTGESSGGGASAESPITITAGTHAVGIGLGGAVNTQGGNSTLGTFVTTIGGGAGDSGNGGSGGGGRGDQATSGTGTASEGFDGGLGEAGGDQFGGGGGGAGAVGGDETVNGGAGGSGVTSSVTGSSVEYARGGNGGNVDDTGAVSGRGFGGPGNGKFAGVDNDLLGVAGIVVVRY